MQPLPTNSAMFSAEQRPWLMVEYWDTPFSALTRGQAPHDLASQGVIMEVREPLASTDVGTWQAAVQASAANALLTTFRGLSGRTLIEDGRTANVAGYWAGGAPGHHGATLNRRVGYYFKGVFRSTQGRGWFSTAVSPSLWFALGGQGYVRLVKNGTTNLFDGILSESAFLTNGLAVTQASTWAEGDSFELVYIQDLDPWGGFLLKAGLGSYPSGLLSPTISADRQRAVQDAVVVGAGLFDTGTPATYTVLPMLGDAWSVQQRQGQASRATFSVPLVNPSVNDGIGWTWSRTNDPTGHLVNGATTVYRQRLVRLTGGFLLPNGSTESYPLFTGFIDDLSEAATGQVTVTCLDFTQRLADQAMKNYPDRLSYQSFGYRRLNGTVEPVYDLQAYDNWPLEFMLRDLLVRGGIDESNLVAPLLVPQADGTQVAVVM